MGSNDFSQRRGSNDCAVPLRQLSEHDLLCQAATALAKVTRCKNDYEPLIINLKSLHGKAVSAGSPCSPQVQSVQP